MESQKKMWRFALAPVAAIALLAACSSDSGAGDNDSGNREGVEPPATEVLLASGVAPEDATTGGVEGCGDDAVGDIDDRSPDQQPARCEPGYPAPVPLDERTTVKVAVNFRIMGYSPILLGDHMGEFAKENIDVEIVDMPSVDALPLLAKGEIDIATSAPDGSVFSAIAQGLEIKVVAAGYYPSHAGDFSVVQEGVWARADAFADPDNPDAAELEGQTLGSAVGFTSAIMWPLEFAFNEAGISLADLRVEQLPSDATVQALRNDAVQAAWVLDPYWQDFEGDDDFVLIATAPPAAPLAAYVAGPNFLEKDREVGVAFMRAMLRTINTYYADGYPTDDETIEALAEVLDQSVDSVLNSAPAHMDWEVRNWVIEGLEQTFITLDQLPYDEPTSIERVVDRTLYLDAIGAK